MARQAKATREIVLEQRDESLLDTVLESTAQRRASQPAPAKPSAALDKLRALTREQLERRKAPREPVVPQGYTLLPAGVYRQIRVNQDWIRYGRHLPWIVYVPETFSQYYCQDVRFLGEVQVESDELRGCGGAQRSCRLGTTGALLIK